METWIFVLKGCILAAILLKASISDILTRQVDNHLSVMIVITEFIGISLSALPEMIMGAILVPLPLLLAAMIKPGKMGGADIKIMSAISFLLGFNKGIAALITGLLLGILCTLIIRSLKRENIKDSFPLIPYLGIGCIIAYIL